MIPSSNVIINMITEMYDEGFTHLKMVAGSDRVNEFKNYLQHTMMLRVDTVIIILIA